MLRALNASTFSLLLRNGGFLSRLVLAGIIVELIALAVDFVIISVTFCFLCRHSVFHSNLRLVLLALFASYYVLISVRLFIITSSFLALGKAVSSSESLAVPQPLMETLCLIHAFVLGIESWHVPTILGERLLAVFFLKDYESKSRVWLSVSLVLTQTLSGSLCGWFYNICKSELS